MPISLKKIFCRSSAHGQRGAYPLQSFAGLLCDCCHFRVVSHLKHCYWVNKADRHLAVSVLTHDYIARQQQADVRFSHQRAVSQCGIACAENAMRRNINAQFVFHRCLHVDLGQDAEPLLLQCVAHLFDGGCKVGISEVGVKPVRWGFGLRIDLGL